MGRVHVIDAGNSLESGDAWISTSSHHDPADLDGYASNPPAPNGPTGSKLLIPCRGWVPSTRDFGAN